MNWSEITNSQELEDVLQSTDNVVIFKHSNRCSISSMAKNRLERQGSEVLNEVFLVDVVKNRELSNYIAEKYNVVHQSPQLLLIKDGKVVYHASHSGIDLSAVKEFA